MAGVTSHTGSDWHWPQTVTPPQPNMDEPPRSTLPGAFPEDAEPADIHSQKPFPSAAQARPSSSQESKPARGWGPRKCRICFEVVLPTYYPPTSAIPGFMQSSPQVTYESEDPASGRLIRPCKCKGSSRYVHEGCLQTWRYADKDFGSRNFWQCPTCGFRYRLERMRIGRAISSLPMQLLLTLSVFILATFVLGFVADPIINFYLDPYDVLSSVSSLTTKIDPILTNDEDVSWMEHFIKGLASLGLLSFVKVLFALSPWQWWNLRNSGVLSGSNRAGNGRDRLANLSWLVVVVGIGTFLWGTYKGVRYWSRRTLEKASERVMDVPLADDEDQASENVPLT